MLHCFAILLCYTVMLHCYALLLRCTVMLYCHDVLLCCTVMPSTLPQEAKVGLACQQLIRRHKPGAHCGRDGGEHRDVDCGVLLALRASDHGGPLIGPLVGSEPSSEETRGPAYTPECEHAVHPRPQLLRDKQLPSTRQRPRHAAGSEVPSALLQFVGS